MIISRTDRFASIYYSIGLLVDPNKISSKIKNIWEHLEPSIEDVYRRVSGAGMREIRWDTHYIAYSRTVWLIHATLHCRICYIAPRFFFFFYRREFGNIEKSVTININTRNVNDNGRSGHVDAIARRADGFSIILNHSRIHVLARFILIARYTLVS